MKLRKIFFGLAMVLLAAAQVSAQSVRYGIEGGISIANLRGDVNTFGSNLSSHLGLIGGVFLQLNVSEVFAIQPEILYSQEGTSISVSGVTGNLDLSYVEIPLLLKLYIPSPQVKPNFFAGGSIGFNSLAQVSSGGASVPITGVNSSEGSLIIGAGLDIEKFCINARYQLGLSNIGTTNVQNGTIALMAGYSFM